MNSESADFVTASNGLVQKVALSNLGETIAMGHSKIFCIQLQSGLLMNSHGKALPDGLNELEIVLRLKSANGALVSTGATAPAYSIADPRIYCPVYRVMNGDVMSSYNQLASQGISWIGDTVKTYVNSVANTTSATLQLNDRSMSLKALITALRGDTADNTRGTYSNTSFFLGNGTGLVSDYVAKIAGTNYPQSQILIQTATNGLNIGRCYEEAIKSLAKHGEKYANAQVDRHQFKSSAVVYTDTTHTGAIDSAKGLLCIDLRKFDDAELRMVGLNTASNASPSILELNIGTAMGAILDATTFALVEALWTMDNTGALRVAM